MVQYGLYLQEHQVEEWKKYYVDYKVLKKQIKRYEQTQQHADGDTAEAVRLFADTLDAQIERSVLFFLEQQGQLAARLQKLQEEQQALAPADLAMQSAEFMDEYRAVGRDLLRLVQFLELNGTAVRKILKKFDRRVGVKLGHAYIESRANHQYSHLKQIFKQVGLGAIVGTIVHNLDMLHRKDQGLETPRASSPSPDPQGTTRLGRRTSFLLGDLYQAPAAVEYMAKEEPIIQEIEAARANLTKAVSYSTFVANSLLLPKPTGVVAPELEPEFDWWSLQLNQFNTFLYMVNYYIIIPTSDDYALQLHAPASLCGVIIGATPFCALVSSLVFSKWSNRSYSEPLYASTAMLIVGNLCYAVALDLNSVPLLLLGRALEGLGGARAVNRRYISDHVPSKQRTAASAAFVSAGALGMAAGPFIAGLLTELNFKFLGFTVNDATAPGWLMALSWLGYVAALALCFREPSRAHLERAAALAADEEVQRKSRAPDRDKDRDLERPLLPGSASNSDMASEAAEEEDEDRVDPSAAVESLSELARELTPPILQLLFIYYMLKFAIEVLISESSLVTKFHFQWPITRVGNFLGLLGLTVLPVSTVMGNYISNIYEDRQVVFWSQMVILVGALLNLTFPFIQYTVQQYTLSALLIFVACNVLEGVNLSLLSRIMSPRLSRGTFNCGLLSTEAGTFARVVGDGMITLAGYFGMDSLVNLTMVPVIACVAISIFFTRRQYYALY